MARQVGGERSIPHLRDIFGFVGWEEKLGDGDDDSPLRASGKKKKKQRPGGKDARTLTERDVKHLERHLSMKKTIRKKIMRDLQQAFVEDPDQFRVEDLSAEQFKAEVNIQSLSFLDMLRAGGDDEDDDEDSSPSRETQSSGHGGKASFWRRFTIKGRNKR